MYVYGLIEEKDNKFHRERTERSGIVVVTWPKNGKKMNVFPTNKNENEFQSNRDIYHSIHN